MISVRKSRPPAPLVVCDFLPFRYFEVECECPPGRRPEVHRRRRLPNCRSHSANLPRSVCRTPLFRTLSGRNGIPATSGMGLARQNGPPPPLHISSGSDGGIEVTAAEPAICSVSDSFVTFAFSYTRFTSCYRVRQKVVTVC